MNDDEKRIERAQVEEVFSLGGGELSDMPWTFQHGAQPTTERYTSEGMELHSEPYWYDGPPNYAGRSEFPDMYNTSYRTAVADVMFGHEEVIHDSEGTWRAVAVYTSSGESQCPYVDWAPETRDDRPNGERPTHFGTEPCELCEAAPGDDHGHIYLGDGWAEVVYRLDTYSFHVDLDERGEYQAHVENGGGETVFTIEGDELIEDGFMHNRRDLDGLKEHLVELGIMNESIPLLRA